MSAIIFSIVVATFFTLWRDEVHKRRLAEWLADHREREIIRLHGNFMETLEALATREEVIEGDEWKHDAW